MDYERKTRVIANSYYNMGLERAKLRDLSGASECLKKSLHFNKYMTDARNLLGLIYYEVGEVGEALVQWVISMNFQPEGNQADNYLGEIQRKSGIMETERRAVRRFNQALIYAQSGSEDLAILQLNKVVESKPNYVKAQLLLALLCIAREDYQKAGKAVYKVLQIDRNHPKALYYKSLVKDTAGSGKSEREPEKRKLKNVLSHRQMEDDDVIIPPSYRENTKDQAVWNILAGLLLGAAVVFFLVMPANTKSINEIHNQEMLKYSEQLSQANQKADGLTAQLESIEAEKKTAEASLASLTSDSDSVLAQYQAVIGILQAYKKDDFPAAVRIYAGLNPDLIASADVQTIVGEIRKDMAENGCPVLEGLGDKAMEAGDAQTALAYYLKCLDLKPASWQAKFKAAVIYKGMDQKEQANGLFSDIINNSKDEELSAKAKSERGF
ncbi:tetratricopeptide repeat protein [Lacrimispora sp.]|uniref:tetratricopeptide repeat protein n=1 Tax=Lacrimispora sp. TaxID=2719234 RepID=UPI0028ADB520|nr:tetratricopeptide repeat protein [Lacrimispora sp.]